MREAVVHTEPIAILAVDDEPFTREGIGEAVVLPLYRHTTL